MNKRFLVPAVVAIVVLLGVAVWLGLRNAPVAQEPEPVPENVTTVVPSPRRQVRQVAPSSSPLESYNFGTKSSDESRAQLEKMLAAADSGEEMQLVAAINDMPTLETDELLAFAAKSYATTDDPGYRRDIVMGLQGQNTRRVLPLLKQAARDADPEVRQAALLTIGAAFEAGRSAAIEEAADAFSVEDAEEMTEEERQAAEAAERQALLEEALTEEDAQQIVDILIIALADESPEVRQAALEAIHQLDGDIQAATLQNALGSAYPDVQMGAVSLLVGANTKSALELLIVAMDSENAEVAQEAAMFVSHTLSQDFNSSAEAAAWWRENADNYDDDLVEVQAEPLDISND